VVESLGVRQVFERKLDASSQRLVNARILGKPHAKHVQ